MEIVGRTMCGNCKSVLKKYYNDMLINKYTKYHNLIYNNLFVDDSDALSIPIEYRKYVLRYIGICVTPRADHVIDCLGKMISMKKNIASSDMYKLYQFSLFFAPQFNYFENRSKNDNDNIEHVMAQSNKLCKNSSYDNIYKCAHVCDPFNMLYMNKYVNCARGNYVYGTCKDPICTKFVVSSSGCNVESGVCVSKKPFDHCAQFKTTYVPASNINVYDTGNDYFFEPTSNLGKYMVGSKLIYTNIVYDNSIQLDDAYNWINSDLSSSDMQTINNYYDDIKRNGLDDIDYSFFRHENIKNLFIPHEANRCFHEIPINEIGTQGKWNYIFDSLFAKVQRINEHRRCDHLNEVFDSLIKYLGINTGGNVVNVGLLRYVILCISGICNKLNSMTINEISKLCQKFEIPHQIIFDTSVPSFTPRPHTLLDPSVRAFVPRTPKTTTVETPQKGGNDKMRQKYMKYKTKYLELKNKK